MPEDKNINLHTHNDDTPELERAFEVAPSKAEQKSESEGSSFFENEKSDVYYEDLQETELAEIEAEIEAENQLLEKRKKDKDKARKRDKKSFEAARIKHERDIEEENIRRTRAEEVSSKNTGAISDFDKNFDVQQRNSNEQIFYQQHFGENSQEYYSGNSSNDLSHSYDDSLINDGIGMKEDSVKSNIQNLGENVDLEAQNKSENYKSSRYEYKDVSAPTILETDYIALRKNYENSKNLFKSSGENIPEAVILKYKEDSERFFEIQRKIDQGELTVYQPPQTNPSVNLVQNVEYDNSHYRVPESDSHHSNVYKPSDIKDNNYHDSSVGVIPKDEHVKSHYNSNPAVTHHPEEHVQNSKLISRENGAYSKHSNFNAFEQNMARYANAVYSQTRDVSPASSSVPGSSSSEPVIHNITRARYESLKEKHTVYNDAIASYGEKKIPKETLHKAEQINKIYSAIQSKIDNGNVKVVSDSVVDKQNSQRGRGDTSAVTTGPSALGTQVFNDRSKDNFSIAGKRVGDRHIKPVGTPFQGSPISKYDKLKLYHALELGSPLETATRRTFRAVGSTVMAVARSEQSGTANMMLTGQERAREVIYTTKAMKDLPRQIKVAYHTVQDAATSVRNAGRFLQGKELLVHKEHKPLTFKQINKQLSNPFTSAEKLKLEKKFGSNLNLSSKKINNKILINTANNKNIKAEIKALQSKGAALSATERKHLKSLMMQKKDADLKLRKLHGLNNARADAAIRNRPVDRLSKKSIEKTIRKNNKQALRLSKREKLKISRMQDKAELINKRKNLAKASMARKNLISSIGGIFGKAARESEEATVQGIIGASRVIQNRYVRTVLKVATKTALLPVMGVKKSAAFGLRKLDNKFGVSSTIKSTFKNVEEKAVRKILNSKSYKELHGGIYNRAKSKISSKVPDKIKTKVNKGKTALNKITTKRQKVLDKFNNLKERLKKSKLGKFFSNLGSGFGKFANAFKFVKSSLIKVGFACGSVVLVVALLGSVVTSVGGAVSSLFLGDDSEDGRINLTKYVQVLNNKEQEFLKSIDNIVSDPDDKYGKITVNYQSGTLVNNSKEIISMAAVYFNQDFSDVNAVQAYISSLYNDSHYYTLVESEPYACSGCEERKYKCYDDYDGYATETRKSLHAASDHYGQPDVSSAHDKRYGCKYVKYSCKVTNQGVYNTRGCNFHNNGKPMDKPCSCDNYRIERYNDKSTVYICQGSCPGNHKDYSCNGHTEMICRGNHIDLEVNVMVLGFDEIFYADSCVNLSIPGIDTSTSDVKKGNLIDTFTVTHYCTEKYQHICNAGPPYKTASGTDVTPGRTIAVDKSVIPLGTRVIINGHEYIAEDTGGAIKGKRIDIAVDTHAQALSLGTKTYKVYYSSASNPVESYERTNSLPYMDYADKAAEGDATYNQYMALVAFGQAKEPEINWEGGRNYDRPDSFIAKLQKFDKDNKNKPFTNVELNVFEYVKMNLTELKDIARKKINADYSKMTKQDIIVNVLIPYDKKHPNEYINSPNSEAALAYTFEGWNDDNIEWAENIYLFMDAANYAGLDKINQFSGDNVSYEGVTFTQGKTSIVYYSQYDVRWKNLPYSNSTIGTSGCAPTSMAMIVSSLTDNSIDPIQMCNWAANKGYYVKNVGTAWSFIPGAAANWGLSCSDMGKGNTQTVISALSQGKLVIMSTGSGSYYTGDGHFLVLRGVDANGKILVADPASKSKSETSWTLEQITSGLKNWWIIG